MRTRLARITILPIQPPEVQGVGHGGLPEQSRQRQEESGGFRPVKTRHDQCEARAASAEAAQCQGQTAEGVRSEDCTVRLGRVGLMAQQPTGGVLGEGVGGIELDMSQCADQQFSQAEQRAAERVMAATAGEERAKEALEAKRKEMAALTAGFERRFRQMKDREEQRISAAEARLEAAEQGMREAEGRAEELEKLLQRGRDAEERALGAESELELTRQALEGLRSAQIEAGESEGSREEDLRAALEENQDLRAVLQQNGVSLECALLEKDAAVREADSAAAELEALRRRVTELEAKEAKTKMKQQSSAAAMELVRQEAKNAMAR